jgi:Uma2 family endonuclease
MSTVTQRQTADAAGQPIPPLRNGDRLTAEEFERRYDAMPGLKKAELINGVVYMPSPVIFEDHGGPHFDVIGWLCLYRMATPGVRGADNATLRLPLANRPQPDACLLILPAHGGQVRIDDDGYIVGGPELGAEVAATSENYDLHDKLDLYRRNNVQEYVVWRVFDRAVDWFALHHAQYGRLSLDADGVYRSKVLPGLWLDPTALVAGDMARVAQVTQQGIASPEHAAFVQRLRDAAGAARP